VNKAELVEAIANEIIARKLPLVTDVRDESTSDVRIVLELKPDASAEAAMAYLYKHTPLQTNFNVNLTCLLPTANPAVGQPARVTLRDLCRHFLDHRMVVVTRRLEYERKKLLERLHILDALAKIYDDLDRAIRIIRKADSRQDAAQGLMKAFDLDQIQADAILEIRLYQLARLEISKILEERAAKKARLKDVEALLKSPKARWKIIREDLERIGEKFGDKRRTKIGGAEELEYNAEAYIVHEETTVLLSRDGWLRRVRELKDPSSARLREGDALQAVLTGTTRDHLVLYSSHGSVYVLRVADVPATTGYGEPVQSLLKFGDGERVIAADLKRDEAAPPAPDTPKGAQGSLFAAKPGAPAMILVATARGFGFRATPDLTETTRSGRRVARVADGDEVVSIEPVLGKTVVVAAASGKMLRFPIDEVAELSGPGRGVTLMKPDADSRVVGAIAIRDKADFLAITPEGGERKFSATEVPAGRRAGKGQKVVKRGGVAAIRRVED
jgi:DNA gyrase subunit A